MKYKSIILNLKYLYSINKFKELKNIVDIIIRKLSREAERKRIENESIYETGFLMGYSEAIKDFIYYYKKEEYFINFLKRKNKKDILIIIEILNLAKNTNGVGYENIVKKIDKDESYIVSIIKDLIKYEILNVIKPGNFEYYYISNIGEKVLSNIFILDKN